MYGVRPQFKYPLYHCVANEDTIQADVLVNLLSSRDSRYIWKDVEKFSRGMVSLVTRIGDAVGNVNITHMWQPHFSKLLNSVLKWTQRISIAAADVLNS